jgi:uncharacterized hydrophobic protein (TIGR00271 family)
MDIALAAFDPSDADLIPWASHVAVKANAGLCVLVVLPGRSTTVRRVKDVEALGKFEDTEAEILRPIVDAVLALENRDTAIYACRAPKTHGALSAGMKQGAADKLMLGAGLKATDGDRIATIRRLARSLPHDLLIIEGTPTSADGFERAVIPQLEGDGHHAITSTAPRLITQTAPILAIADPKCVARSKRVYERASNKSSPGVRTRMLQATDLGPTLEDALVATVDRGDVVIVDVAHPKHVSAALALLKKAAESRDERNDIAVVLTRAADAAGAGFAERQVQRIRAHLPELSREDRVSLSQHLESGGRISTDFVIMLALSAAIASFGLIQGSTAVVVGAMLVAPLMTPLVAAGMAIVQGNARVFRQAISAMATGILGALIVAVVVGLLSPWKDLSAEVIARTAPNLFDLAIAALSGLAGAYALARPGVAGTLVGVSIAVALVPPLGAVGIATAKGEFALAFGAVVLFATNLVAIILGAAAAFRFFGLHIAGADNVAPRWVRVAAVLLVCSGIVVSVPLVTNQMAQATDGVTRPLMLPLPPDLRKNINDRVAKETGVEILQMSRSGIENGDGIRIILIAETAVSSALIADLRETVERRYGPDAQITIVPVTAMSVTAPITRSGTDATPTPSSP